MILKLTNRHDNKPVYINSTAIESLEPNSEDGETRIYVVADEASYCVKESVDDIIGMINGAK